jgi:hypothetical protein
MTEYKQRLLSPFEVERLQERASRWTMVQGETVAVTQSRKHSEPAIKVIIYSGDYQIAVFTSDGRVYETQDGHNEPYLFFTTVMRPTIERRFYL